MHIRVQLDLPTITHMPDTITQSATLHQYEAVGNLLYDADHNVIAVFADEKDCLYVASALNAYPHLQIDDFQSV